MLSQTRCTDPAELGLPDGLSVCVAGHARRLGAQLLIEDKSGAILTHATTTDDVPPVFATAVLRRSVVCLTVALTRQRSIAVLPGGPMLAASLPGWEGSALSVPLTAAGQRLGWLWLLVGPDGLPVEDVARAAADISLTAAPNRRSEPDQPLVAALEGQVPLPSWLAGDAVQAWVAAVREPDDRSSVHEVLNSLSQPHRSATLRMSTTHLQQTVYVVSLADKLLTPATAAGIVTQRLVRAQQYLGYGLVGALSGPAVPTCTLDTARAQADAALATRPAPGQCVALADARADIVLDRCSRALDSSLDLGHDPAQALLDRDAHKGSDLSGTMLAWLECHGDVISAAEQLNIHPNTMRYRLRRLHAVAGTALDVPAARLEMHLRLRAAHRRSIFAIRTSAPEDRNHPVRPA